MTKYQVLDLATRHVAGEFDTLNEALRCFHKNLKLGFQHRIVSVDTDTNKSRLLYDTIFDQIDAALIVVSTIKHG